MSTDFTLLDGEIVLRFSTPTYPGAAPDSWADIFLHGTRVGCLHDDTKRSSGWRLTLNRTWGAPRDHDAVYLTKEIAIEHALGLLNAQPSRRSTASCRAEVTMAATTTQREQHAFGSDTWETLDHPDVPDGWELKRITILVLECTACGDRISPRHCQVGEIRLTLAKHRPECSG